ncbi:F420H(2)-dependent quinone reductase [soil metagenome]
MPLIGEYEPSTIAWARDQAELIESSGGTQGIEHEGQGIILMTSVGAKSGKLRKNCLMRVEHNGQYAIVASKGGADVNPSWFHNVVDHPHVELQDGPVKKDYTAHEASGAERAMWWDLAVAAFPTYGEYQTMTDRLIPLFVLTELTD